MVLRHESAIGAFLVRRVGRDTAEDLLGEVWVAAFAARKTYDQQYPDARPWLYTVALNQVRHHWRSQPPEDLVPDLNEQGGAWDPWPMVQMRVDAQAVFRDALAGLRSDEREVLTLVAGEDLTAADAARVLGIPAGTARRLLHQARETLRGTPEVAALLTELNSVRGSR
nr:sigma-70 family RNA polymerase sigma factor [Kineosporia rhizophila]